METIAAPVIRDDLGEKNKNKGNSEITDPEPKDKDELKKHDEQDKKTDKLVEKETSKKSGEQSNNNMDPEPGFSINQVPT